MGIRTTTVDGRNPAPPGMYKTLQINSGINYLSTGERRISEPSTVVTVTRIYDVCKLSPSRDPNHGFFVHVAGRRQSSSRRKIPLDGSLFLLSSITLEMLNIKKHMSSREPFVHIPPKGKVGKIIDSKVPLVGNILYY